MSSSQRDSCSGFTLVEVLVATAVFLFLVVVLASVADQAAATWSRNENRSDVREAARAAVSLMGSEMRQAVLPLDRGEQAGPQFVINPDGLSSRFLHRDAVFWQAPVATSRSRGDLAIVGYFVRRVDGVFRLCRLLVNPDDPSYRLHDGSGVWLDDGLLDLKAPGAEANDLMGVFLENVPGMWVSAYTNATDMAGVSAYDSRATGKLPNRVEIALALLDRTGAERVGSGAASLPDARDCATLDEFMSRVPERIRANVQTVTISVPFEF